MTAETNELLRHRRLVDALKEPSVYAHPVVDVVVHETHISSVVVAGDFAYKLKKPLDLGFLDFRDLAARQHYCQEELRVNARLAPAIYRQVVTVTVDAAGVHIDGPGEVVDYAVCMERFDQSELLGSIADRAPLPPSLIGRLAEVLVEFHGSADVTEGTYGDARYVQRTTESELVALEGMTLPEQARETLSTVGPALRELVESVRPALEARYREGAIRECHGDLHLDNLLARNGDVVAFDAIEFAPELRWIDTASDIAFPVMDLFRRGLAPPARHLRSRYLELSGDYASLRVLPFYTAYRALVRAKVTAIQQTQSGATPDAASLLPYLTIAEEVLTPDTPKLLITHGLSGSGKSTVAQEWVEQAGVIRLRSDVERKRLFGLAPNDDSGSAMDAGIYTGEATARTYDRLTELARGVLRAGYTPLVDATFLRASEREQCHDLAAAEGAAFGILALDVPEATLRERLRQRAAMAGEASEADERVLDHQLERVEPLTATERGHCLGLAPHGLDG